MLYALIQNNEIKVGPRQYHKGMFGRFLTENSIDFSLPHSYDSSNEITINGTTKIVPVTEPLIPSYHPITEQLAGPTWNTAVTPVTGEYTVADVSIESVKNTLKALVAQLRYEKESEKIDIVVQGQTVSVSTARDDRHIWFQSSILLPEGSTQNFKFGSDVWLQLTKSDISSIVGSIMVHVQNAFNWESIKVAAIDAADKAGLETIYAEVKPVPTEPTIEG